MMKRRQSEAHKKYLRKMQRRIYLRNRQIRENERILRGPEPFKGIWKSIEDMARCPGFVAPAEIGHIEGVRFIESSIYEPKIKT